MNFWNNAEPMAMDVCEKIGKPAMRVGDMWLYKRNGFVFVWDGQWLKRIGKKNNDWLHCLAVMPDIDSLAHLQKGFSKEMLEDFVPMGNSFGYLLGTI